MLEYAGKAAAAWFLGFFPYFEVYLAVPAAIAMGLDYTSAVVWSTLGNFASIPLILYLHRYLERVRWIGRFLEGLRERSRGRLGRLVDRYGPWCLLVALPLVGAWVSAAGARTLDLRPSQIMVYGFFSIFLWAVLTAVLVHLGIELFFR